MILIMIAACHDLHNYHYLLTYDLLHRRNCPEGALQMSLPAKLSAQSPHQTCGQTGAQTDSDTQRPRRQL